MPPHFPTAILHVSEDNTVIPFPAFHSITLPILPGKQFSSLHLLGDSVARTLMLSAAFPLCNSV